MATIYLRITFGVALFLSLSACLPYGDKSTTDDDFHPSISGAPSALFSTISASVNSVTADGVASSVVTVHLKDVLGLPMSGKSLALVSSRGLLDTISAASGPSDASGVVSFTVRSTNAGTSNYSANDITDSFSLPATVSISYIAIVSPTLSTVSASATSVVANGATTSTITVSLKNPGGVALTGKAVTLVSSRGGTDSISAPSGVSDGLGQVTFTIHSLVAGDAILTATDSTDSVALATTPTIHFIAGGVSIADSTVVANPTSVTADGVATSTITVTLMDSHSNLISGKTVSLASSRADTISSASGSSDVNGVVTFTVKSSVAGNSVYTATDSTDGLTITATAAVSFGHGLVSVAVSTFTASVASLPTDGTTSSTLTVTLLDSTGNPVSGKTVSVTSSRTTTDTLAPASAVSDASGAATFTIVSSTAGSATLTATDSTDALSLSTTRGISFIGSPDHLVLVSGNNQVGRVGSTWNPLRVRLVDQLGQPYTFGYDLSIDNTLGFDAPKLGPSKVTTDSSGYANFSTTAGWMLNLNRWKIFSPTALPDAAVSGHAALIFTETTTTLGDGTFTSGAFFSQSYAAGVAVMDFNRDASQDFVTTNITAGINKYSGHGDGSLSDLGGTGVGSAPNGIVVADFNGDGYADIATLNVGSDNVSVMLGNAAGGFDSPVNYAVASVQCNVDPVCALSAGDVNGDGKVDLIVASQNANAVGILLGDGAGGFGAATNFDTAGGSPVAIALGDFNGDGKIDMAVANYGSGTVGVFLGNGSGGFSAQVTYGVGSQPSAIVVGDFNGDGKLDIAVSNEGSNSVSVLMGNGDGTFQGQATYGVGAAPVQIVTGDFNHDGVLDLAIADYNSNGVSLLIGNSDGTFQPASFIGTPGNPIYMAVGDFNGDGKLDIAVTCLSAGIQLLMGH